MKKSMLTLLFVLALPILPSFAEQLPAQTPAQAPVRAVTTSKDSSPQSTNTNDDANSEMMINFDDADARQEAESSDSLSVFDKRLMQIQKHLKRSDSSINSLENRVNRLNDNVRKLQENHEQIIQENKKMMQDGGAAAEKTDEIDPAEMLFRISRPEKIRSRIIGADSPV